jgi:hypothetical protein
LHELGLHVTAQLSRHVTLHELKLSQSTTLPLPTVGAQLLTLWQV